MWARARTHRSSPQRWKICAPTHTAEGGGAYIPKDTPMKRILIGILVTAAVLAAGPARRRSRRRRLRRPREEEKIPTVKFKLHPAAEPRAALKYQLLPEFLDRKPGNAAVIYNKIGFMMPHGSDANNLQERLSKWLETPLAELPREEIEKTLAGQRNVLDSLDRAARRETCDWELPLREENPIAMLLPELQETRGYARLLAVKARLEIAKGEFDAAIHTLQTGYALGLHVAEGPTLISALVGMAICGIMSNQVEELIAAARQPQSLLGVDVATPADHQRPQGGRGRDESALPDVSRTSRHRRKDARRGVLAGVSRSGVRGDERMVGRPESQIRPPARADGAGHQGLSAGANGH